MGIHRNPLCFSKCSEENNARSFSADSGQRCELFHRLRHFAVVLPQNDARKRKNMLRFGSKKSRGVDALFECALREFCKILGIGVVLKELIRNPIDHRIRALGGKKSGNKELESCCMVEECAWRFIELLKLCMDNGEWDSHAHESSLPLGGRASP